VSIGTAVFQAIHKLERIGVHTSGSFDPNIVAAICLVSIAVIFLATRLRRLPLPPAVLLAAGGITYPLYLLHMQAGYVIFLATGPSRNPALAAALVVCGAIILAFAVWRFVERPLHRWTKNSMTAYAGKRGWKSKSGREYVGLA